MTLPPLILLNPETLRQTNMNSVLFEDQGFEDRLPLVGGPDQPGIRGRTSPARGARARCRSGVEPEHRRAGPEVELRRPPTDGPPPALRTR